MTTIDIKKNLAVPLDEFYDIELREKGSETFKAFYRKPARWVQALILEHPDLEIRNEFSYILANKFRWKSMVPGNRHLVSYTRVEVERKLMKGGKL